MLARPRAGSFSTNCSMTQSWLRATERLGVTADHFESDLQRGVARHMVQDNCFQAKQQNHCPASIKAQTKEQLPLFSFLKTIQSKGAHGTVSEN